MLIKVTGLWNGCGTSWYDPLHFTSLAQLEWDSFKKDALKTTWKTSYILDHFYNKAERGFGLLVRATKPSETRVVH